MRAVLVKEFGPPDTLVIEDVPDLAPGPHEVVIDVRAASVNYPDLLVVDGSYQNLPRRPFSPGMEVAGRVVAVGEHARRIRVGQRVVALLQNGGYAEQARTAEDHVVELPDDVSFVTAAALGLAAFTAYCALEQRAHQVAGETVLVTGAGGGVGAAAVQIAKARGAQVIALARDPRRRDLARRLGADIVVTPHLSTLRDDLLAATDGRGVDVVVEVLGGDYLTQVMRAVAWQGRIVLVGFASGTQNPIKPGHLLVKNISVLGLQATDYRDRDPVRMRAGMAEILSLASQRRLDPAVDATYPLERAAEVLQSLKDGHVSGKAVLVTGPEESPVTSGP